jgi:hypothetical protein
MTWGDLGRASERVSRTERVQRVRDKNANANNYKKCCSNLDMGIPTGLLSKELGWMHSQNYSPHSHASQPTVVTIPPHDPPRQPEPARPRP